MCRTHHTQLLCGRAALEADKRERAAAEPVTKASVAQPLPGEGARIFGAADAGIKCDC